MANVIWECVLPMKKGQWDNNYIFNDDGTIIHEYDVNIRKYNLSEKVKPTDIPQNDKAAILSKVNTECPAAYRNMIITLLN